MKQNFVLFATGLAILSLGSCLGSDPIAKSTHETSIALCTDGLDNDGDNNFDCYDSDCRALDSTMRLSGDTLCHYERYGQGPLSSSVEAVSSSSAIVASSSSAADTLVEGFPLSVRRFDEDTVQILSLYRKPGSTHIAISGRLRSYGLFGVIDTAGKALQAPDIVRTGSGLSNLLGVGSWTETGRILLNMDTSAIGDYMTYGASIYAQGQIATSYGMNQALTASSNLGWPYQNSTYAFLGINTPGSICMAVNQADTGYAFIDENASDNALPSYWPVNFLNGSFASGRITGDECALVGTHSTIGPDSSQIWFFLIKKTNDIDAMVQVSTGSTTERAIDLEVIAGKTYIAATVDGSPRLLVLATDHTLDSAASAQILGAGTIRRMRTVTVNGTPHLLLMGASAGKAALWLMDTDGSLTASTTFSEADGFADALQLDNGRILVAGWKANSSGIGTTGVILQITTALNLVP